MTSDLMTIREMSDLFDVTPRTLRFYEAKELLFPVRVGQKRLFTKRDRARLKLIIRGKRFGFELEEMRQLLNMYDDDKTQFKQLTHTYRLGLIHLEEMKLRRDELEKNMNELREQMECGAALLSSLQQPHLQVVGARQSCQMSA